MSTSIGAIWRQWDLHFHTPASYDYQDRGVTDHQLVDSVVAAGVQVLAITDHHLMDIPRIRRLQRLGDNKLIVIPGIELRTELGGSESIHIIGLFSEKADLERLWVELQGSLNLHPSAVTERGGDDRFYVDFKPAAKRIKELGGIVSVHAGRKSNSIEGISNQERFKQAVKTDLLNDFVDVLEVGSIADIDSYRRIVFPAIGKSLPIVLCSDNHNASAYHRKTFTWVKSAPGFDGLRHVLREPIDRVYVGGEPELVTRVRVNPTKYIKSIAVSKVGDSNFDEDWFDCNIDLNSGLVAIIGNKGSGKSALADIISLLGDTAHPRTAYSFLSPSRFCKAKDNKATHFTAKIEWHSGGTASRNLSEIVAPGTVESVRYLPQSYLESICNELASADQGPFYKELKDVIFSHIAPADRMSFANLDEIISYRTQETRKAINLRRLELKPAIERLAALEARRHPSHKLTIKQNVEAKQRELAAHEANRPLPVAEPPPTADQDTEFAQRITTLAQEIASTDEQIDASRDQLATDTRRAEAVKRLIKGLKNLEQHIAMTKQDLASDISELGMTFEELVTVGIDYVRLDTFTKGVEDAIKATRHQLSDEALDSAISRSRRLKEELNGLQAKLDAPHRQYREYLQSADEWERRRQSIVGSAEMPDTLKYFQSQESQFEDLPREYASAVEACIDISLLIWDELSALVDDYKRLYQPVQAFIKTHPLAEQHFRLEFEVDIVDAGIADQILGFVAGNKKGSFRGAEGTEYLRRLVDGSDVTTRDGFRALLQSVLRALYLNVHTAPPVEQPISEQIKVGKTTNELFALIFGLEYLSPHYRLRWSGKEVSQLSPGERGTLLLIFYLLVDRSDVPLVVDQPEENLDNQTVYDVLVPCIKEAKKRRQVILVTHNPNLAVVCDADQIIHSALDKVNRNKVSYRSGAIEDAHINQSLVKVLEGTWPAFNNRRDKYITETS